MTAEKRPPGALLSVAALLIAIGVVVDRWLWAGVGQWGSDSAIPLRLAESLPWHWSPVGSINSAGDPNLNGMVWLAWPLTALPTFRWMTFVVSMFQVLALVALGRAVTPGGPAWPTLLPLVTAVPMRFANDFWGQWLLIALTSASMAALFAHITRPRLWLFIVSVASAILGATVYLPGVVNVMVMTMLWTLRLWAMAPEQRRRAVLAYGGLLAVAGVFVVSPYMRAVDVSTLHRASTSSIERRLASGAIEAVRAPITLADAATATPWFNVRVDEGTHFAAVGDPLALANGALAVQVVVALMCLAASGRAGLWKPGSTITAYGAAAVVLFFVLESVITGILPARYQRSDQVAQWVPLVMAIAFAIPFMTGGRRFHRLARIVTVGLAITFAALSAFAGEELRRGLADPALDVAHRLGIPATSVEQAAQAVAADRPPGSQGDVRVEYDIDREHWSWVPEYIRQYDRWLPREVKADEAFDLALERLASLRNSCGRLCPPGTAIYIVKGRHDAEPAGGQIVWRDAWLVVWRMSAAS